MVLAPCHTLLSPHLGETFPDLAHFAHCLFSKLLAIGKCLLIWKNENQYEVSMQKKHQKLCITGSDFNHEFSCQGLEVNNIGYMTEGIHKIKSSQLLHSHPTILKEKKQFFLRLLQEDICSISNNTIRMKSARNFTGLFLSYVYSLKHAGTIMPKYNSALHNKSRYRQWYVTLFHHESE